MKFEFEQIGVIRSCFKEKFGIPRQPGLVVEARARLELFPPYGTNEAVRGLEEFSHMWVVFVFHGTIGQGWRPTIRPPRLGGNAKMGVFASRSPFRPNPVGMSAVEIEAVASGNGRVFIDMKGGDFLDGTPVLDIKPYVAWSDSPEGAKGGYASERPEPRLRVRFSERAAVKCGQKESEGLAGLSLLIKQALEQDPRPSYHGKVERERVYGMRIFDMDVKWKVDGKTATVLSLEQAE